MRCPLLPLNVARMSDRLPGLAANNAIHMHRLIKPIGPYHIGPGIFLAPINRICRSIGRVISKSQLIVLGFPHAPQYDTHTFKTAQFLAAQIAFQMREEQFIMPQFIGGVQSATRFLESSNSLVLVSGNLTMI